MNKPGFLQGGGEMGELIRNYNWEKTTLGKPEHWPQSLQTTAGIILHSAFPMFLFWGKELACFYNDAYRPSLGVDGKHPALGKPAKEVWPEIWDFIGPLIDKVLTTGEAVWFEDQLLPIYRNGKMEEVYWTFSYSPAYGDDHSIQGVFVTCTETTESVVSKNKLQAAHDKIEKQQEELLAYFEQSPVAIATISKENLTFRLVNPFYGELVGRTQAELENKPLLEALPELAGQGFDDLLKNVIATGEAFIAEEVAVDLKRKGQLETIYVNLTYQPQRDAKGEVVGILVVATDVTLQVVSRKKAEESEARLGFALKAGHLGAWELDIATLTLDASDHCKKNFGQPVEKPFSYQTLLDSIHPGDRERQEKEVLETIATGKDYDIEYRVTWPDGTLHWVNIRGELHKNSEGKPAYIIGISLDITDRKLTEIGLSNALDETKKQKRLYDSVTNNTPDLVYVFSTSYIFTYANKALLDMWGKTAEEAIGKGLRDNGYEEWHARMHEKEIDEIIEKKNSIRGVVSFPHAELGSRVYDYILVPVLNERGEVEAIAGTTRDITDIKRAEEKMLQSESRFRTLLEEAPFASCLYTGRELTITLANELMLQSWGKTPAVIGKTLREAMPELEGQPFFEVLDNVFTTGETYQNPEAPAHVEVNGRMVTYYFNYTLKALRNEAGEVYAIINTNANVTEQVLARKTLEESGARLKTMIDQTPAPTLVLAGDDLVVEQINEPMLRMIGRGKKIIGIPLITIMPELEGQYIWEQVEKVYWEGIEFDQSEVRVPHKRDGVMRDYYYNIAYRPLRENGKITGMIQVAIDVTEQVLARQKIEESEAHLQLTRDAVPAMIFYLDAEERYRSYNGVFMHWFNVNATEALGKTTKEFIGEAAYATAGPLLAKAYAGERVEYQMHAPKRIDGEKWLNIVYTPHKISDGKVTGVIVHATDITEHMLALRKIEESEARFRNLLQEAPVAATLFSGPDLTIEIANELTLKYWGKNKSIIGKPLAEAAPELEDQQMIALVKSVYETGRMVSFSEAPIRFMEDGVWKDGFYSFSLKALYNSNGGVESILSTGIDVTEQVNVRKKIEQSEKELRDLITAAPIGICVLSGTPVHVEEVNDRFLIISGKTREQYASAPYWKVLSEVAHIFEPILSGVFQTGIKYTTEENEMVLVRDGVPERISITFEYVPVFDSDNKVSKVIVMAIEVTHQVETRKEIEEAVVERTKELAESNLQLKRSNEELEQFAYIASHDLQEPVRKISTFTQMLERSLEGTNEKSKDYFSKIYSSTDRMTKLIRDVLAYSQIREEAPDFEKVDLNKIVDALKTDFELQIERTGAAIEISGLPVIDAIQSQMVQLFSNLLSNSLKFRKPEARPVIKITASIASQAEVAALMVPGSNKKYYHIQFSDNGIGFDKEHVERIFKIFQRLHGKTEFEGTGIGLSICLRIVQNHGGHISAAVGENGSALFNILLPEVQQK